MKYTTPILAALSILASGAAAAPQELEEVVVTARRREERLQDAPVAVTVASPSARNFSRSAGSIIFGKGRLRPSFFCVDARANAGSPCVHWNHGAVFRSY